MSAAGSQPELEHSVERVKSAMNEVVSFAMKHQSQLELAARDFAYSLARVYTGMGKNLFPSTIPCILCEKYIFLAGLQNNSSL